jgi:2-amino-4-hydroxy-6-hydroxymethyldihydropteridine diphosphokinase
MNNIYILIGGNVGDRIGNLKTAINLIQRQIGRIAKSSSIYETAAWGNTNQADFLNQVLLVESNLEAKECMQQILSIEDKMGRIRNKKNDPRLIDIDILFFNNDIIETHDLIIPHPQIQNRNFVLYPMNELSPQLIHPVLQETIHSLFLKRADTLAVQLYRP